MGNEGRVGEEIVVGICYETLEEEIVPNARAFSMTAVKVEEQRIEGGATNMRERCGEIEKWLEDLRVCRKEVRANDGAD